MQNLNWNIVLISFFTSLFIYAIVFYTIEQNDRYMNIVECMNKTGISPRTEDQARDLYNYCAKQ